MNAPVEFKTTLETIAGLLPGNWHLKLGPNDYWAKLERPADGIAIGFYVRCYPASQRGKVESRPCPPPYPGYSSNSGDLKTYGIPPYGTPEPSCGFSLSTSAKTIAARLVRDMVQPLETYWPLMLERRALALAELERRDETANALAALNGKERTPMHGDRFFDFVGPVTFATTRHAVEIRGNIGHETAIAFAEWLRSRNRPLSD